MPKEHQWAHDRKICPTAGKVILSEYAANAIIGRDKEKEAYRCQDHWHVGHPTQKGKK